MWIIKLKKIFLDILNIVMQCIKQFNYTLIDTLGQCTVTFYLFSVGWWIMNLLITIKLRIKTNNTWYWIKKQYQHVI
jgi:hypothetical protein